MADEQKRPKLINRIRYRQESHRQNDTRIAAEIAVFQKMGFTLKELILLDADHTCLIDMIVPMRFIEKP